MATTLRPHKRQTTNPLVRARVPAKRKERAEKVLAALGIEPGAAINMFYAHIERKRALPFSVALNDNVDVLAPDGIVAETLASLDDNSYDYLKK